MALDNTKRKVQPIGIRQKSLSNWKAPYETDLGELAGAHPIANVIGLGIPALAQKVAGGIGNAASIMATPDTRTTSERVTSAVEGSNLVTGVKSAFGDVGTGSGIKVPLVPGAQAATPQAQKASPIGTPMLASHGPGTNTPLLASHGADLNQVAQAAPNQPAPPVQPKVAPIGTMSVQGGGSATIDAQGNINRDAAFVAANRADAIKNHGGIGGAVNTIPSIDERAASDFNPDGSPKYERRPEQVMVGGQLKTQMPLAQARASGLLSPGQQQFYTNRDLEQQAGRDKTKVAEIGLEANKYAADQGLAAQRLAADATVQAAEIGAEGNKRRAIAESRLKVQENEQKNAKETQKTFYDSIKGLDLPAGYEGKHMELAKVMAQDADPNVDLGIFYSPGQNRQGIAAKKSKFDPLLAKYLQAGMPPADAHANAYRDLQELEKQDGVSYHRPFPNLAQLRNSNRKPAYGDTTGE